MELNRAIEQISRIHDQLNRNEVYRGIKSIPIAAAGVIGLFAAALQNRIIGASPPSAHFVYYWGTVAVVNITMNFSIIAWRYFYRETERERRKTRQVAEQFLPCVAAGFVVTLGGIFLEGRGIRLLPGLWAVIFSLGAFSTRPFQPKRSGWVALYYFISGVVLLALAPSGAALSPWGMGLVFGLGHILSGGVLYWNLERNSHV